MVGPMIGGVLAGLVLGYVLQRGQLCFHSAFRGLLERRTATFKAWLLGVALTAVGLALLDILGPWQMSTELALRPLDNILGGLVFGVGMAVAASCVSGLFYKLGAGMLGALVGLAGWVAGELLADQLGLGGGGRVLAGRETLPTLLGVPRLAVATVVFAVVAVLLWRNWRTQRDRQGQQSRQGGRDRPAHGWQWTWPAAGVGLGLAATATWVSAGASGTGFGASTVGAASGLVSGSPNWWQVAFLVALVPGAALAARTAGGWWLRGETRVRYAQLAAGGVLLGAGARWAGGCNLGHALSGVGQLNLSSLLVVASMIAGVGAARFVQVRLGASGGPRQDPAYQNLPG